MTNLAGQVALVTGASSGIGAATARRLAEAGATVVLAARRRDRLDALAAELEASGGKVMVRATDVGVEADVAGLFADMLAQLGRLDILVNNAGIGGVAVPVEELSIAAWQRVLDINLTAAFLSAREAFRIMKPQRHGRIINIGSTSARVPREHSAAYTASKFAIAGLTHSLAIDGRKHGIAVSVIHPGGTVTEISPIAASMTPGPQVMAADDIARIILLMASLPPGTNLFEALALPLEMPFLARG